MRVAVQQPQQHDERDRDHGDDTDRRHPDRGDAGRDPDQRQRDLAAHEAEKAPLGTRRLGVGDLERRREVGERQPGRVRRCLAHRGIPRASRTLVAVRPP